jgi:uncharacterized membrane protein YesL
VNIFEEGSALQRFLGKMTDLMILNIVTLLMCLPVITAGAALTGMHYVLLKMVRGQEGYIVRSFFRSFKRNLLQATIIWGMFLVLWYLVASNLILLFRGETGGALWLLCALSVTAFVMIIVMIYTFAILSRFDNTVLHTLLNAVMLTFGELPRSLEMLLITLIPLAACSFVTVLLPLLVLFGLSVPGYACAMVYEPVFAKIERQMTDKVTPHKEKDPDDGQND